ncbi:MAG: TerB family tellurite resistance protein [Gemmatimonadota bacterium]
MSILDGLNERIAQHRNRDFLKAAMAAGALAAQADGAVTLSERYRIDDILARLERLRIYDPHKAVQILDGFLTELRDNAEAAERVLLGKLRRIAEDREAAELVVRIALSVSESDGRFSAPERARFEEICAVLGFSRERFLGERRTGG